MEYLYQPDSTAGDSRLFRIRPAIDHKKAIRKPGHRTSQSVQEVKLGGSFLARLGYWLLMRNARDSQASYSNPGSRKKNRVTRSVLRQNKSPEHLLSIVSATGRKSVVRVENGASEASVKRFDSAVDAEKNIHGLTRENRRSSSSDKKIITKGSVEIGRPFLSGERLRQSIASGGKKPDQYVKKYEQDLFVKTERNIAAAMKEAQKGISADQLVVRFGLSVPEACLIAGLHKVT